MALLAEGAGDFDQTGDRGERQVARFRLSQTRSADFNYDRACHRTCFPAVKPDR